MDKSLVNKICYSIIIGCVCLGIFIFLGLMSKNSTQTVNTVENTNNRYELISHGNIIFIFDRQTGQYWQKYTSNSEGTTEWSECESPIK